MRNKTFYTLLGLGQVAMVGAAAKPNLVVIHTDEQSFRTLSCYQQQLPEEEAFVWGKGVNSTTPNIDKLAKEGAICNRYYCASPVSTPSRASMFTGLYPQVTGAPKNGDRIRRDIPTLGSILTNAGYSTSYVGKWHLEGDDGTQYYWVKEYNGGFTDNKYMMYGGHAPYFLLDKNGEPIEGKGVNEKAIVGKPEGSYIHLTDFFTDKTIEVIKRDQKKPFCVVVSIPDPHTPDYARPPYNTMYDKLNPQEPKTMKAEYADNRPAWGRGGEKDNNEAKNFDAAALKQYFGMVKHIDDCVGRIMETLDKCGLTENTIIVFTSDHGDMFFEHKRRNKGVPYEASARIPFVIRYPKAIPAGKVINSAYVNTEFTPTMLGLMGVKTDAKFHGVDNSAEFVSKAKTVKGEHIVHFAKTGGWWVCATDGRYKLVLDKKETPWLLDLEKDPMETQNFYNKPGYEKVSADLQQVLLERLKATECPSVTNTKQPLVLELLLSGNPKIYNTPPTLDSILLTNKIYPSLRVG
ncbi:MAG: sulfatase [Rikenellaceae bacterium]